MREILIATPEEAIDIYRQHQQVWEHAQRAAMPGVRPTFLFRAERGLIRVRSPDFARGTLRRFLPEVPAYLDLAAIIQSEEGRELSVPSDDLPAWAQRKLAAAGFDVLKLSVIDVACRAGEKMDRLTGRRHSIALPVASLKLDLAISDEAKAKAAWATGIGRGRRFGLGMLTQ